MTRRWILPLFALVMLIAAPLSCSSDRGQAAQEPIVTDLSLTDFSPVKLIPGSLLIASGNFGDIKDPIIELDGQLAGRAAKLTLAAKLVDGSRIEADWPGGSAAGLPSDEGIFTGSVRVLATGGVDLRLHVSPPLGVSLELATLLVPTLGAVEQGLIFVNHRVLVSGADYLLGGQEGTTLAIVEGCFTPASGGACAPIGETAIPVTPELDSEPERSKGHFPFAPRIAGIKPGTFEGTVRLRNDLTAGGSAPETARIPVSFELLPPQITDFSPARASLGQYVDVRGGGFVGADPLDPTPAVTTIELTGSFTAAGGPGPVPVSVSLVPEYVEGKLVRYVLNEEDALGTLADLRKVTGDFAGTATPIVKYGQDTLTGAQRNVSLGIDPVKQVVWLRFLPSYIESLRHFGLRAADARIRERVFEVCRRDFGAINVDFRSEQPTDFALYATVEIGGADPNDMGLLGYDNSPGKDVGNLRLYDKIGGVNALTQEDGYPGYGGVFVQSLFGFSEHPGSFADALDVADPLFDQLFDPFRPDRGGQSVSAEDLAAGSVAKLVSGASCPAESRSERIACAVFALGSLIGTTTSHEVAHSFGLADPSGSEFHNPGDAPNRIMDSGSARSFRERAEIGDGPAVFCQADFAYLRGILPTSEPDWAASRPSCD